MNGKKEKGKRKKIKGKYEMKSASGAHRPSIGAITEKEIETKDM